MKQTYSCTGFGAFLVSILVLQVAVTDVVARKRGPKIETDNGDDSLRVDQDCTTDGCFNVTVKSSEPPTFGIRSAHLSWNDFSQSGGTGAAQCTERFYPPSARVVALSTDLFNKKHNCHKVVTIYYKRKKSTAMVVDQCAFEDGCPPNTIDASTQVWHDLGIYERNPIFGGMSVTWTMAS